MHDFRSPSTMCFRRTFWAMISQIASTGLPLCCRRTGGMRSPSWYTSVESTERPPATRPPISMWSATMTRKASSLPSLNTGLKRKMSGRWLPPQYGSLRMKMSPGWMSPSNFFITDSIASGMEPRCRATQTPCATMRPSMSHTAHEKSMPSRMLPEYAVRIMVSVISSTIESSVWRSSSNVIRSMAIASSLTRSRSARYPRRPRARRNPAAPRWSCRIPR